MLFYNDRGTKLQITYGLELNLCVAFSEALNAPPPPKRLDIPSSSMCSSEPVAPGTHI